MLTLTNVLSGDEDFAILHHLILNAKSFIYDCKLNITKPTLRVLFEKLKLVYHIEGKIAKQMTGSISTKKNGKKIMPLLN